MKQGHLVGTTVPMTLGTQVNEFGTSEENFRLMHEAGLNIVRVFVHYPFADGTMQTLDEEYRKDMQDLRRYLKEGFDIMVTPMIPGKDSVDSEGTVSYVREYPAWMGPLDQDYYFEMLEKGWEYVARELGDAVTWWQIGNEQDIPTFIGELTHEQNVRWLQTAARGVKKGSPNAKCGTNLAGIDRENDYMGVHTYAKKLLAEAYAPEGLFDFIGLDAYFGSWHKGGPEDWVKYIDDAHEVTGLPVIISEWGYSTLQAGTERDEEDKNRFFNTTVCRDKCWAASDGNMWQGKEHTEELQGDYIRECVKIFAEHPHCIGNLFFQWQDQVNCWQCGEPDCPAECAWGCIRTDGTPKPGYYVLAEVYKAYFGG